MQALTESIERNPKEKEIQKRKEKSGSDLKEEEKCMMETWYYVVVNIDGDYANLKRTDIPSDDLKLVARALLPSEINEGSRLKYEMFQYELID